MPRPARQSPASRLAAAASLADDSTPLPSELAPSFAEADPVGLQHWAEAGPARALQSRLGDHYAHVADKEKLPLRARVAVILGASLGLWGLIIKGMALLVG